MNLFESEFMKDFDQSILKLAKKAEQLAKMTNMGATNNLLQARPIHNNRRFKNGRFDNNSNGSRFIIWEEETQQ